MYVRIKLQNRQFLSNTPTPPELRGHQVWVIHALLIADSTLFIHYFLHNWRWGEIFLISATNHTIYVCMYPSSTYFIEDQMTSPVYKWPTLPAWQNLNTHTLANLQNCIVHTVVFYLGKHNGNITTQ